jgi:hypothetical protein
MEIESGKDCVSSNRLTILRLRSRMETTHSTTDESLMQRLAHGTGLSLSSFTMGGLAPIVAGLALAHLTRPTAQASKIRLKKIRRNPRSPRPIIESAMYKGCPIWLDWQVLNYLPYSKDNEPHIQTYSARLWANDVSKSVDESLEHCVKNLSALLWANNCDKDDVDTPFTRVKNLSARLWANNGDKDSIDTSPTRALRCLGYCKDSGQFSLVFQRPLQSNQFQTPVPLYSIINHMARDGHHMAASLAERATLMYLIAETVERLHAAGWLLISLQSTMIHFFERNESNDIDLSEPFISGLGRFRPIGRDDLVKEDPDDTFLQMYKHPSVQQLSKRNSFKRSHDLYALGLLLLEIAYWRPLSRILDPNLREPKHVRKELLSQPKYLEFVEKVAGETIADIIRKCLEGPEAFSLGAGFDKASEEELAAAFNAQIVTRLRDVKGVSPRFSLPSEV